MVKVQTTPITYLAELREYFTGSSGLHNLAHGRTNYSVYQGIRDLTLLVLCNFFSLWDSACTANPAQPQF